MDFARPHVVEESVASKSKIRSLPPLSSTDASDNGNKQSLDAMLIESANRAAADLLLGPVENPDPQQVDTALYPERSTPRQDTIRPGDLVVIMESFDNLDFLYAKKGDSFTNRNGIFHHDDFLGKPFGSKIRSRNNRGYGFCYLLKPTPELWARSLNHRTQIVHELDQAEIIFQLHLRPNMTVVESGTGSGAMSHAIIRTIAPHGRLHTYEFNGMRAETARKEFHKNGVDHLVTVHHIDVCGKDDGDKGGFDLPGQSADAIFLDLPEPWLAVPHASFCLKPNARIATYSPCVEQTQRTVQELQKNGFHSIKTMEYRLQEHYVDEVEYEPPPKEKRPRLDPRSRSFCQEGNNEDEEDTGAEADNEKTEGSETEPEPIEKAPASNKRKKMVVARPFVMMRGHTAFLTFATAGTLPRPDPNARMDKPEAVDSPE